jgi:vesicular inhibitory amino acid transporter
LVGVGILSEPLAFASAGWLLGTILIIFYGALSCYT